MKTKYKYIHFEEVGEVAGWLCLNNKSNDLLGTVTYYTQWQQYVIQFERECIFNNQCLLDIADFLKQLKKPSAMQAP